MSLRKESIKKLKEAIENRTLGCYKGATECNYYDAATDSRCAVGAIVPDKVIEKMKSGRGDCSHFVSYDKGSCVDAQLKGKKTYRGMTIDELSRLQELYDDTIIYANNNNLLEKLEAYIYSLK